MPKGPESGTDSLLQERYGNRAGSRRRDRVLIITVAAVLALAGLAWLIFASPLSEKAGLSSKDLGSRELDQFTVEISWSVSADPGTAVSCALQAQNESHGIVGWKVVDLPASESRTNQYSETVRTVQTAVTGLIYRCWLT